MPADLADDDLVHLFDRVPDGVHEVWFDGARWTLEASTHADDRARAVTARRLADGAVVGANLYLLAAGPLLRPCEVPAERVITLLAECRPVGPRDDGSRPLVAHAAWPWGRPGHWRTRLRAWWWQRPGRGRPPDA